MKYHIIWRSLYGVEEVDACDTYEEAKKLRLYYERLYGGWPIAMVTIEKRQLHTKGE
jgi:hypothetical protein